MNSMDIMIKRKKFFEIIFPTVGGSEFCRVLQVKEEPLKVKFFNDIDSMNNYIENNRFNVNTYFNISTTNGRGGKEEDIITRSVIAFDFDKKDFNKLDSKDIMYKFKELGLWYHALIDSGNGYHAYICIETTGDIRKVVEVTKAIGKQIGADVKAMKSTQVLRVPYTFNIKDVKTKQVNIITQFEKSTIKRYDINKLYNRFCNEKYNNRIGNNATTHIINNINMKLCIVEILENGSVEGNRNNDLQKIVVTLRRLNKDLKEIQYICKEWNNKNEKQLPNHELEYQVSYIFKNVEKVSYECKGCQYTNECWNKIESDFEYLEDEELINIEYKIAQKLKYKRGVTMNGNELLIFNILKHWDERELNIEDIIKHLTFKSKCRLSLKTIRETLKSLEENKFIIRSKGIKKQGIKDTYKINPIRCEINKRFSISYFPTLICIYGIITTTELRLYHYMRYAHDVLLKDNKARGNIFRINQIDLAKDLKTDPKNISVMIKNLIEAKILEIWDVKKNKKGLYYYTYRLVK